MQLLIWHQNKIMKLQNAFGSMFFAHPYCKVCLRSEDALFNQVFASMLRLYSRYRFPKARSLVNCNWCVSGMSFCKACAVFCDIQQMNYGGSHSVTFVYWISGLVLSLLSKLYEQYLPILVYVGLQTAHVQSVSSSYTSGDCHGHACWSASLACC